MTIIPAIDIIDGAAVRLTGGDYKQKKVYYEDPLEAALQFEDAGIKRLHLVDLDGAKLQKITNIHVLELIASHTSLEIDYGGGVTSRKDVLDIYNAGAKQCTIGSLAVKYPEILADWVQEFGAEKFLIGADVLREQIRISGWLEAGGISLFEFLNMMTEMGISEFFCTDISKDGKMSGPSVNLYKRILAKYPDIHLIASGGVVTLDDLRALKQVGCSGAIIGKAIYEKTISLKELKEFN